ncbi:UNVERIFIED_CONTAM: Centromere/kinetochore protein zw10 [Sesamum angustifolium]|uniref:Centromere/kinetochore protein zw10 n=1 Tax=Sesamum angustifolium TaxID=2727405 RepID=A0AAW2PDM8_9LAMI
MDVLFNSINVRDLLSSLESPSSPLSAPDLRLLISRLDAHSLRIKSTVQSYLLSHHDDFSSLFSQCSDVVSKSERLSDDVVALLNLISDQPIESDVGRIFREIVEKTRESREKREILEFVEVVLELDRKLGVVSNNVKNGKVAEAAEGLKELKIALGVKGNGDAEAAEGEPVVYGILKKHWSDCFEEVADILDYGLARIADLITKYVFTPVVSCRAIPSFTEETNQDLGHASEAVLKLVPSVDTEVVPDDASKLAEFQVIRKLTIDFETALKQLMFISQSDIKDEKLSKFADNVEVHFAARKKVQILAKARNMLLQSNFSLPQDVCVLPPKVGLEFYHTARNALLLYEAIIPVKLQRQLDSINQAAVLIHNDCLYLSQEVLGLHLSSVKEIAVFIDLAPRFQLMAEEVLQQQIQLVLYNLKQAIDGANGFQNTHQIKQFESAKFCIDQVAFIIEKVHIIWEPLLLPSVYEKSMAMILEAVFSRITKEILLLDDMAAEETLQNDKVTRVPKERDEFILSIWKLRKLAELLDMPLKSITASWESGELAECNFTSSEVEDFIRAIFTDSPLRKECLFRIENTNFR